MFKALSHVALRIRDLDATLDFYCGKLGCSEVFRLNHPQTGKLWLIYIQVAKDQFIEVFPTESGLALELGGRFMHLCLEVADVGEAVAELRRRGVAIDRDVLLGPDGNYQAWIKDPDGNDIELMQIDPTSNQGRAISAFRR